MRPLVLSMPASVSYPTGPPLFEPLERRHLYSTYYFSPSGSQQNGDGSRQHPMATLAEADTLVLHPGDRLLFEGGKTFDGNLRLGPEDSGTAADPVTIGSYGRGVATIDSPIGVGILAHDCGGIVIANLRIVGPGRDLATADGIQFVNDLPAGHRLSHIAIDHVDVSGFVNGIEFDAMPKNGVGKNEYEDMRITHSALHDDSSNGIFTEGNFSQTSTEYSFSHVYVGYDSASFIYHHSNGMDTEDGIQLSDVQGGVIEHCSAHDNGLSGNGEVGIWAWDSNRVTIQNCVSFRNHTAGPSDGDGFDLDGGCTDCVMQFNYSHDNDGAGFALFQFNYARAFSNNIVRDNLSVNDGRNNGYGAIDLWNGNGSEGISHCRIYGNIVYISAAPGATPSAIQFETATNNIDVYDNVFVTSGGIPLVAILDAQQHVSFSGNRYQTTDGRFLIVQQGKDYFSLKAWKAASGQESTGLLKS